MANERIEFSRTDLMGAGTQGHHIFDATTQYDVFKDLRDTIDPATGRAYFDIGNAADNIIHLRAGDGTGASALTAGDVPQTYNFPL